MSSSQGGRVKIGGESTSGVITAGYAYDPDVMRDSSDWTRRLRERSIFISQNSISTGDKTTNTDPWYKYGNDFRLQYDFGRFKCQGTTVCANAFSGSVLGNAVTVLSTASLLSNCVTYTFSVPVLAESGTYTTSSILAFQALTPGTYKITYSGIGGALRQVQSTATAANYVTQTIRSFTTGDTISLNYSDIIYMYPAANNGDTLTVNICKL